MEKKANRKKRRLAKVDEWLLDYMADNDNFEWTNAFTGAVITGDATVQQPPSRADAVVDSRGCAGRPIVAHVARSTASWRQCVPQV